MPKVEAQVPKNLRPYEHHGVILSEGGGPNAKGDCPFCGRAGKFSVRVDTGVAKCWVCEVNPAAPKGGVNPRSFIQRLWELAVADTTDRDLEGLLAVRRGVRTTAMLRAWGCARAPGGEWFLPGWDAKGLMCQLYRWGRDRVLMATPKADGILGAGLFMGRWEKDKPDVFLAEGPWDGMALEDVLAAFAPKLASESNVVAVAGCGAVGEAFRPLLPMFAGKRVTLCFDSDHPRKGPNGASSVAGRDAAKRAAELLGPVVASVSVVWWGDEGFDPALKSGYDLRDTLGEAS